MPEGKEIQEEATSGQALESGSRERMTQKTSPILDEVIHACLVCPRGIEPDAEGIQNWSHPVCSFEDRLERLCSRGLSAP